MRAFTDGQPGTDHVQWLIEDGLRTALFDLAVARARGVMPMTGTEGDEPYSTSGDVRMTLDQPFEGTWGDALDCIAEWLGVESPSSIAS